MDKINTSHAQHSDQREPSEATADVVVDSAALARLLDEVRNDTAFNPSAYNRSYNRHNR